MNSEKKKKKNNNDNISLLVAEFLFLSAAICGTFRVIAYVQQFKVLSGGPGAGGEQRLELVLSEPLLRRVDGHVVVVAADRQVGLQEDKEESG